MDRITPLTTVVCLVDDWLAGRRVRQRGPAPALHDSEVLTTAVVGAFLGADTDAGLDTCFRRHYPDCFPVLTRVDRPAFTRQAAHLWPVKEALWQHLLTRVAHDPHLSIVDRCPPPVCRFARAPRCRRPREHSAYGYGERARRTYYGLRRHLRVCWPGVVVGFSLAPANAAGSPPGSMPVAEARVPSGRHVARRRGLGAGGSPLLARRHHDRSRRARRAPARPPTRRRPARPRRGPAG